MKPDHLSYRRAATVSLVGLAVQFAITLTFGLYGYYKESHAAVTAALFSAVGLLVWVTLAILFDQQRRERVEAIEAESLASEAASSVFESGEDDLRVAARRLETVNKIGLPVVSAVVGLLLVAVGFQRFAGGSEVAEQAILNPMPADTVGLFVGLSIAFIGFIFGRYTSGMAKQDVWHNLRAGAAFAAGSSVLGLALAVAQFIRLAEPDVVLRLLPVVFPVAAIALGGEIFLNILLNLYRPRKRGEQPRVAFESRVLAFVAAPDRIADTISEAINYQFGFNVTGSWFYQLLSRAMLVLLAFGLLVIWGLTSLTVVEPHQRAMVLRFGSIVRSDIGPGLHLKMPWPIDRVVIPELEITNEDGTREIVRTAAGLRRLQLGTAPPRSGETPILWTETHTDNERFQLVQSGDRSGGGANDTNDLALMAVEVPLQYAVVDVEKYDRLGPPNLRDQLLEAVGRREVMLYLSQRTVADLLGEDRAEISRDLRARIASAFAQMNPHESGEPIGAGIEIVFVGVEGVHPPQDTAASFEDVVNAQQNREGLLEVSRAEAIERLTQIVGSVDLADRISAEIERWDDLKAEGASETEIAEQALRIEALIEDAGGEAAATLAYARADRWTSLMSARAASALYTGQLAGYVANPSLYAASIRFDAIAEAMSGARVYLTSDEQAYLRMRYELQDRETQVDVFDAGSDFD